MHAPSLTIADYGEAAVMVTVEDPDERVRQRTASAFRARLLEEPPPGFEDVVSGLESLLVEFDPLRTTSEQVAYALGLISRAESMGGAAARLPRHFRLPIVVDEDSAPDLAEVAAELGIGVGELSARIEGSSFTVSLLAAAMAPMMTGLDVPAAVKRRGTPRTDVPPGSVMIAGRNAIIQPFSGPTGWRVVGRSPLRIVDIARAVPVSFAPGDTFSFVRVSAADAAALHGTFLEEQQ